MTTQTDIVNLALSKNGEGNGQGYAVPTPYNGYANIPDCALFCSWVFRTAGVPLPSFQAGYADGGAYVPYLWNYAAGRGATKPSWTGQPGDLVLFDWTGTGSIGPQSHIEVVTGYAGSNLFSVGADSGPSNVDGYKGAGGVHRHWWPAPQGAGNNLIMGIVDTSKLVHFGASAPPPAPPAAKVVPVKVGGMHEVDSNQPLDLHHPDVKLMRYRLGQHGQWSSPDDMNPGHVKPCVTSFQHAVGIAEDGDCGDQTWSYLLGTPR